MLMRYRAILLLEPNHGQIVDVFTELHQAALPRDFYHYLTSGKSKYPNFRYADHLPTYCVCLTQVVRRYVGWIVERQPVSEESRTSSFQVLANSQGTCRAK